MAVFLASELVIAAPRPNLVQEINVNQSIRELDGFLPSTHSTFDLVFSPDEKWIAIGIGRHRMPGIPRTGYSGVSHVLLVPLGDSKQKIVQIEPGVAVWERNLFWAPNSDALVVSADGGPHFYSVPAGKLSISKPDPRLGLIVGFIDAEHVIARRLPADLLYSFRNPVTLEKFGLFDGAVEEWTAPGRWSVDDVSPDQHTVAITDGANDPDTKTFVLDYRTKSIIQEWPEGGPFSKKSFAEAGKTVCAAGGHGRGSVHPQCWSVASGKRIAEFSGFTGGQPAAVSSHGSRVVLSHIRFFPGITSEYDMKSYKNRVVWDFRTGKEVAAWVPQSAVKEGNNLAEWLPFAISPTGRYLAEGGNGILRIYEIP